MKRGFTLIELLAIIVVISVLITLTTVSITKTIKNSKSSLYNTQVKSIQSAAEQFASENLDLMPKADSTNTIVTNYILLSDIQESGIIDKVIKNPKNNKKFTDDDIIIKISSIYNTKYKTSKLKYEVITDSNQIEDIKNNYTYALLDKEEKDDNNLETRILAAGSIFNGKIKALAAGDVDNYIRYTSRIDKSVISILFLKPSQIPSEYTKEKLMQLEKIDISYDKDNSILALWDGYGNLYVYSDYKIKLYSNSGDMFFGFNYLNNIMLYNFDTSNVTNMSRMFSECRSITNLDLGNFDTSNVTNMSMMFGYNNLLSNINLSSFNTKNVVYMGSMFEGDISLSTIDLSNFDTSNVTNMSRMFRFTNTLSSVYVGSKWTTDNADISNMFEGSMIQMVTYK